METGHNKNVANFETTIIILTNLGAQYAPPQALIVLTALQQLLDQAKAALLAVDEAEAARTVKVDEAQAAFKDLPQYVVNIKRQAEVEVNDPSFTKDLQTIVNKFSPPGRDTGKDDNPATPDVDESRTAASQSQRSRDNLIAHLMDIVTLLKARDEYKATGTPYATAAIDDRIAALTAASNAAKAAEAAYGTKKDARDEILYDDEANNLLSRVKLIKAYVALKFGKDSAPYRQIAALEFRRVKP